MTIGSFAKKITNGGIPLKLRKAIVRLNLSEKSEIVENDLILQIECEQ
jgi:hypothetical protein